MKNGAPRSKEGKHGYTEEIGAEKGQKSTSSATTVEWYRMLVHVNESVEAMQFSKTTRHQHIKCISYLVLLEGTIRSGDTRFRRGATTVDNSHKHCADIFIFLIIKLA